MAESELDRMRRSSHLAGANAAYIEAMYETYLAGGEELPPEWQRYFGELPPVSDDPAAATVEVPHSGIVQHFERIGRNRLKARPEKQSAAVESEHERKQMRVLELIASYRHRGHKRADIDPLRLMERPAMPVLDLAYHGLSVAELEEIYATGSLRYGDGKAKLREIVETLEKTYCGSIGAEYMHIVQADEQIWVQHKLESVRSKPPLTAADKRSILERLTAAEGLEKYLHGRYPGTKRFGLEGAESLIPCLHEMLQRLGSHDVLESVVGMAHRGRLNVLVNILGKDPWDLFSEFDGKVDASLASGDVKYHQGFSTNVMTIGGEMHLALAFNPSHLEIVGPVVAGSVRARQDRRRDYSGDLVVPIVIHGDAAFSGQGVVMETLQMSQTRGFKTGGTVHIILNNQIGFTTNRQDDARSTEYCTEIAKMVQAPIFHVNGDDPEAVVYVTKLASDYRMYFRKDVVIDLVCYRRRGHNESEEPMKTQPLMYKRIRALPTTRERYVEKLIAEEVVSRNEAAEMADQYRDTLESGGHVALSIVQQPNESLFVDWRPYLDHEWTAAADTRVPKQQFIEIAERLARIPDGFELQRQVGKTLEDRGAHDSRQGAGELGLCGGHGLRHPGHGRPRGTPDRPGRGCGHLFAPPRLPLQPGRRQALHSAQPSFRNHQFRHLRLAAVGRSGARLRIRLRHHHAHRVDCLGGPVRRFRQRRPGGHRPVRLLGRGQVGAALRPDHAAAARLRRRRPGTFLGAPGALPATQRRAQHAGVRADHPVPGVSHAAPPGDPAAAQTAGRADAEEPAPAQAGHLDPRRIVRRRFPHGAFGVRRSRRR